MKNKIIQSSFSQGKECGEVNPTAPGPVSDQQRFQEIKAKRPSERTDDEIAFANAFSKSQRQEVEKTQAGAQSRQEFLSGNSATTQGKLKAALSKQAVFNNLTTNVGDLVESLFNQGWRMALDSRGNRQFTNGSQALGTTSLGKVGMNYADFLSSNPRLQPQTATVATQTETAAHNRMTNLEFSFQFIS